MKQALLLIGLLVIGGCSGLPYSTEQDNNRSLGIYSPNEETVNGSIVFTCEVAVGGKGGDFTARDVRLRFVNEVNATMQTVRVGTLTERNASRQVTIELESPPKRVFINASNIESDAPYTI